MKIASGLRLNVKLKSFTLLALLAGMMLAGAGAAWSQAEADGGQKSTPVAQSSEAREAAATDENDVYRHSPTVVKVGKMLGMKAESAAVTFEVLNFAALAILVGWFLVKTLPKVFRDRNSAIQKHLVDARIATEEANLRMSGIENRLAHLDEQMAALRAQSEKDSAADEARIKAGIEEEKKKILAAADQEIASATVHAQRQLQQYAAELAIEQAAKKLVISAETDRLLVKNFARRLGEDVKGGEN